jgi:hypothetical protein
VFKRCPRALGKPALTLVSILSLWGCPSDVKVTPERLRGRRLRPPPAGGRLHQLSAWAPPKGQAHCAGPSDFWSLQPIGQGISLDQLLQVFVSTHQKPGSLANGTQDIRYWIGGFVTADSDILP